MGEALRIAILFASLWAFAQSLPPPKSAFLGTSNGSADVGDGDYLRPKICPHSSRAPVQG